MAGNAICLLRSSTSRRFGRSSSTLGWSRNRPRSRRRGARRCLQGLRPRRPTTNHGSKLTLNAESSLISTLSSLSTTSSSVYNLRTRSRRPAGLGAGDLCVERGFSGFLRGWRKALAWEFVVDREWAGRQGGFGLVAGRRKPSIVRRRHFHGAVFFAYEGQNVWP